jgi:hypothetical protein
MEHKKQKVASHSKFVKRLARYSLFAFLLILVSILIGVLGYHYFAFLNWIDSFQMACLILTGMGPTDEMPTNGAKIFSSIYALYSGITFLTISAIIFSPILHRILHILHIENSNEVE